MNWFRVLILLVAATALSARPTLADGQPRTAEGSQSSRILFIVAANDQASQQELQQLRRPSGTFEELQRRGWKIGETPDCHIQIVEASDIPKQIELWGIKTYPTVLCVEGEGVVRSFRDGCSTPLDVYTFTWLLNGISERPPNSPVEAISVPTTGSYPLRGNHWNFEGNWNPGHAYMVTHLRGPNHERLFPQSWPVESWSEEELRSLHDDLHEMGRPRLPLKETLEPGNSVRPGEVVPVYRPVQQAQGYVQPARQPSAPSAGATNAATRAIANPPSSGYSKSSGSGFF